MTIQYQQFDTVTRPDFYRLHNGQKAVLPFSDGEYEARLAGLRAIMANAGIGAAVLTSMHNIAYYSGFLYCAFGRPYALVVTPSQSVTISAGIDAGQPWRRCHFEGALAVAWKLSSPLRRCLQVCEKACTVTVAAGGRVAEEGEN